MKKNLILMSALFAGSMFLNDGFSANDGFGGNYVIDIDDDQNDEEFNPPEDINDDDYDPSSEEELNDLENLYYDNIENPIVRIDTELNTLQNDLKELIEAEHAKLPLTKRINKKTKKIYLHTKCLVGKQIANSKKFVKNHREELIICGTLYAIDSIISGIKLYKDLDY